MPNTMNNDWEGLWPKAQRLEQKRKGFVGGLKNALSSVGQAAVGLGDYLMFGDNMTHPALDMPQQPVQPTPQPVVPQAAPQRAQAPVAPTPTPQATPQTFSWGPEMVRPTTADVGVPTPATRAPVDMQSNLDMSTLPPAISGLTPPQEFAGRANAVQSSLVGGNPLMSASTDMILRKMGENEPYENMARSAKIYDMWSAPQQRQQMMDMDMLKTLLDPRLMVQKVGPDGMPIPGAYGLPPELEEIKNMLMGRLGMTRGQNGQAPVDFNDVEAVEPAKEPVPAGAARAVAGGALRSAGTIGGWKGAQAALKAVSPKLMGKTGVGTVAGIAGSVLGNIGTGSLGDALDPLYQEAVAQHPVAGTLGYALPFGAMGLNAMRGKMAANTVAPAAPPVIPPAAPRTTPASPTPMRVPVPQGPQSPINPFPGTPVNLQTQAPQANAFPGAAASQSMMPPPVIPPPMPQQVPPVIPPPVMSGAAQGASMVQPPPVMSQVALQPPVIPPPVMGQPPVMSQVALQPPVIPPPMPSTVLPVLAPPVIGQGAGMVAPPVIPPPRAQAAPTGAKPPQQRLRKGASERGKQRDPEMLNVKQLSREQLQNLPNYGNLPNSYVDVQIDPKAYWRNMRKPVPPSR